MKKLFIVFLGLLFVFNHSFGQISRQYSIDVSNTTIAEKSYLNLGGVNANGDKITVNNYYIEKNSIPFFPIMGEFHYSRYPNVYWDEEIKKIKAGGINVIATYVFWIMHEPKEGVFNWEGDLNLRKFVELCKENGINVIVRIGPFDHGEIRNGGLPDWIYGKPFEVRSNDPEYLNCVKNLYTEIGKQLNGLYFKDGGPILGIQIENEYQHSAAPWSIIYNGAEVERTVARHDRKIIQGGVGVNATGNDYAAYGQKHMQTLKTLAKEAGMDAPIYTATGWGYASIINNASIPVMAGYAYPTWVDNDALSNFYLFKDIHKNPDYSPVSYNPELYPALAAELGTGMCNTYSKRPKVPAESFVPLMIRTLGSGANGLGYYMYHGGTTPSNGYYFLTEGFGYNNKSYDYQAPIGEFGKPSEGFYSLKLINYFLQSFGSDLAPLQTALPEQNSKIIASDTNILRYSVRTDGKKGFVFMLNFQDHLQTVDLKDLQFNIKVSDGTIKIPENGTFCLKAGSSAILPFNMVYNNVVVQYSTAQPLCSFSNAKQNYFVFFSQDGLIPEFLLKGDLKIDANGAKVSKNKGYTKISSTNGNVFSFCVTNTDSKTNFLIIPREKALQAYVIGKKNEQHILFCDALVLENNNDIDIVSFGKENIDVSVFPEVKTFIAKNAITKAGKALFKGMSSWNINIEKVNIALSLTQYDDRHFVLNAPNLDLSKLNDVHVKFDYKGDKGQCFMNGEMVTDNFYYGDPWIIGLKKYVSTLQKNDMYFYFTPILKNAPYMSYIEKLIKPNFSQIKEFLEIKQPQIIPEYKISVNLK